VTTIGILDPGPKQSAYAIWDDEQGQIVGFLKTDNSALLVKILRRQLPDSCVVIEQVSSYGMAVGADVFETVHWAGRFHQALLGSGYRVDRMKRLQVKQALCHDSRAKDSNIICVIVDRLDPDRDYGKYGKGTKGNPGPCFGLSKDCWQALALAMAYAGEYHRDEDVCEAVQPCAAGHRKY
jgi:hypothetical protein